jgi:xanthine dehydrogenase iron-sulfur cluster and FAD-binding subunit A
MDPVLQSVGASLILGKYELGTGKLTKRTASMTDLFSDYCKVDISSEECIISFFIPSGSDDEFVLCFEQAKRLTRWHRAIVSVCMRVLFSGDDDRKISVREVLGSGMAEAMDF